MYAPVRLELCRIKPPYDRAQATDLLDWQGDVSHPGYLDLLRRLNELLPPRKTLATRTREWFWTNRITNAALLFAAVALAILGWQISASKAQLSQMTTLIHQQKEAANDLNTLREQQTQASQAQLSKLTALTGEQRQAASDLKTLQEQAQATEKTAEGRYEQTLNSLWNETNQIAVDDITVQIRFEARPKQSATLPNTMFEDNWDLLISIRSPKNADRYTVLESHPTRYYSSAQMFKDPIDLTLLGASQTSRPIRLTDGLGQFSTYKLLRHHYIAGDFDRWRIGHQWNGAVVDAVWTSYEAPKWLALSRDELPNAPREARFGLLPKAPLDARLVLYVRGLAIAKGQATAVQLSPAGKPILVVRFPRMTISGKAFTTPPFETADGGQQRTPRGRANQKLSTVSRKD